MIFGAENFYNKVKAVSAMLLGIVIIAGSVGTALGLSLLSWPSVIITLTGTFIGTFMIFGSLRQFSKGYFRAESEELAKSEQARIIAESELSNEKAKNNRLEQELDTARKNNLELEHRLTVFANVTKIQPAFKIVPAEIDFDINDFYEKPIDDAKISQNFFTKKYTKEQDFYRGVYHYSGKTFLMVDLATIKLFDADDKITIYGPFAYSQACEPQKEEWLLHGRREHESWFGKSEEDMAVDEMEITVTKTLDYNGEEEQKALVRENVKHLKMIEQMRTFTDCIVKHLIEAILMPTGKQIIFIESNPVEVPNLTTLGEFISDFNRRIENCKQLAE